MKSNINQIINGIKKDINKYSNSIAKNMAKQISEDMEKEAHDAITDFYNDYSPIYYNRHYNFMHSYKKYYKNYGNHFSCGVELLLDNIPNDYSDPVDEVFYRVYAGFHGYASIFDNESHEIFDIKSGRFTGRFAKHNRFIPERMTPSPMDRLIQKRNEIIKNSSNYQKEAMKKARKEKYNYLSF